MPKIIFTQGILEEESPELDKINEETELHLEEEEFSKWYIAPYGVDCYDRERDTMIPYGFQFGSGSTFPMPVRNTGLDQRNGRIYTKPLQPKKVTTSST